MGDLSTSETGWRDELEQARSLAEDGLFGEALIVLRRLVSRIPDLAEAHHLIAVALSSQGIYDEALEAAERCLQIDPEHASARKLAEECRKALSRRPDRPLAASLVPGGETFVYEPSKKKVPMRRCPSCGKEIVRGAQICRHCGNRVGLPPWLRKVSACTLVLGLVVAFFYFVTSFLGPQSLEPILIGSDGGIIESPDDQAVDVAVRIDRLKWYPGPILPAPVPADSGDQIWLSSYRATCSGRVTNASDQALSYLVLYVHYYGKKGTHFGSDETEIAALAPGQSKEFEIDTRLGNRPSRCEIAIGATEFRKSDWEPAAVVESPQRHRASGFPWLRFSFMCILSMLLLFVSARLQLVCNPRLTWDYELIPDAVASVLAVPCIIVVNAWLSIILAGAALGPIAVIGAAGPILFLFLIVAFFFKRGLGGTILIWFFYGCLWLSLHELIG